MKVVNTLKFKVVSESVKKTDRHDAGTLAEFFEKDMLSKSQLCSQESEDIRRVIKSRVTLVKAAGSLKNKVYVLSLSFGIETKRGQLQSNKERQRLLTGLGNHKSFGGAAKEVEPLLSTINQIYGEVRKLEMVLSEPVKDDDVELLKIIPGVGQKTAFIIGAFTDIIQRFDSVKKYMKKHKGSGKSIIATTGKMSTVIYTMLKNIEPFDELKMASVTEYKKIQAAVFDAALIEEQSA